ncbi:RNA-directed DNA polymerase [Erysipelothrix rhusiopathiae]|uniref:RNA-directed DNA polymerase n=1 Tax=Erysipelothrix rhusiopathiae TaxID=1648 RepID=UPI0039E7A541
MTTDQILEKLKENYSQDLVCNNIFMLWSNLISDDLPSNLSIVQRIDSKKIIDLFERIKKGDLSELFNIDDESGLIKELNLSSSQTPPYIYNLGAEKIEYLVYKHNNKFRKITIPNFIFFIVFIYNTIIVYEELFKELYLIRGKDLNEAIKYSTSPIIDPIGKFEVIEGFYETIHLEYMKGVIHSEQTKSILFDYFKLEKLKKEGYNKFILKTDIENFYNNIYTHQLSKLKKLEPYASLDASITDGYFDFLDMYNMKINENQTKGIITGPISSSISAELLMITFDYTIHSYLADKNIEYSRFVDDMFFYSNSKASLEDLNLHVQTLLHNLGLETKFEKTSIRTGFDAEDYINIESIHQKFPMLNHEVEDIYNLDYQLFTRLRFYIIELLDSNSVSAVRIILTKLKQKINLNQIIVVEDMNIVDPLISFILKMSQVNPELIKHAMKLLEVIVEKTVNKVRDSVVHKLVNTTLEISKSSPNDTLLEIWLHYIINKHVDASNRERNWKDLKEIYEGSEINPLIILSYIKLDEEVIHNDIQEYIVSKYKENTGEVNINVSISYSKWWIVIIELHNANSTIFRELFVSKKCDNQLDKLGLFYYIK